MGPKERTGLGIAAVVCAIAGGISFVLPPRVPPSPRALAAREDAGPAPPAEALPSIWGEDELGSSSCEVVSPTRRVRYDFDDAGRLVRTRAWSLASEGDAAPRPLEVTRYAHAADGLEVQVRHARRVEADDPYAGGGASAGWSVRERRIEHRAQGEWLHQRTSDADGERERLFRIEDGRLALESPLRLDELMPESDRCQFDAEGRPVRHVAASGPSVEWRYEGGALAAVVRRESADAAPSELPVRADGDAVTILLDRYAGECAEVIFAPCSTVMASLPGRPLPEGLVPR